MKKRWILTAMFVVGGLLGAVLGMWLASPPSEEEPETPKAAPAAGDPHDHGPGAGAEAEEAEAEGETTWTCSMHPSVQLPEPGQCPICGMDLIPVEGGGGDDDATRVSLSSAARAMSRIQTTTVERRPIEKTVRLVGRLDYDETRLARITAWLGGRIERMFVDYAGTQVEKGDHLFELYSPELLVAQQELLQAQRLVNRLPAGTPSRNSAEETLRASKQKLHLWGLQRWQVGRVLKRGRPQETVTIYAPIGGTVVQKATLEGSYVETGSPVYTIADLSQLWLVLDAYESDLQWIRYGQPVDFEVAAFPGQRFHGRVTFISPTMDSKTRSVRVRVNVNNPDRRLKPDMFARAKLEVTIGSADERALAHLEGRYFCPMHPEEVSDEPGRCDICGMKLVPAEEHWLVGSQMARSEQRDEGTPLAIPTSAPLLTGKRAVVFVEQEGAEEPTYLLREVTLGPRGDEFYVVADGLMEGEDVVSEGAFKLDSALQIRGDRSVMTMPTGEPDAEGAGAEDPLEELARAIHDLALDTDMGEDPFPPDGVERIRDAVVAAGKEAHVLRGPVGWLTRAEDAESRGVALATLVETAGAIEEMPDIPHVDLAKPERPAAFSKALDLTVKRMEALSASLAADDLEAAREDGIELREAIQQLVSVDGPPLDPALPEAAEEIAAEDADLERLRAAFGDVAAHVIPLVTLYRSGLETPWQLTWCPMAFDDEGAYWLQEPGDVANPYFGSAMLQCGSAEEVAGDAEEEGSE
ncbi:MAG: efflux RND transporter periplasmic adaptor subunit [Myxococcota bacterium]